MAKKDKHTAKRKHSNASQTDLPDIKTNVQTADKAPSMKPPLGSQ